VQQFTTLLECELSGDASNAEARSSWSCTISATEPIAAYSTPSCSCVGCHSNYHMERMRRGLD